MRVRPSNPKGSEMKDYPNVRIRGNMVYLDYTPTADDVKYLTSKKVNIQKRYRVSSGKTATPANIKWVSANPLKVIENAAEKEEKSSLNAYALQSLESGKVHRVEKTVKDYAGAYKNYIAPYFGQMEITEIKASAVAAWQAKLMDTGLSASRVRNIRATFQTIIADAIKDEIITKSPFTAVKPPRIVDKEILAYTIDEVRELISAADDWFADMLTLLFFTGMRTGEMMALEWGDINFQNKKIHISKSISHGLLGTTKTNKSRVIDMLDPVHDALRRQYARTGLKYKNIFDAPKTKAGWRESKSITDRYWKPLVKRCGLMQIDFYDTRHTFASIMLSYGENVKWVAMMMGHASTATTEKYYAKFINDTRIKRAEFLQEHGFVSQDVTSLSQERKSKNLRKEA